MTEIEELVKLAQEHIELRLLNGMLAPKLINALEAQVKRINLMIAREHLWQSLAARQGNRITELEAQVKALREAVLLLRLGSEQFPVLGDPNRHLVRGEAFDTLMSALEMKESKMDKVTIFEHKNEPGVWSVERIDDDGGIEQTIFIGPKAEQRCRDYAFAVYQITETKDVE